MSFDLKEVHRYYTIYSWYFLHVFVKCIIIQARNDKKSDQKLKFPFSIGFRQKNELLRK